MIAIATHHYLATPNPNKAEPSRTAERVPLESSTSECAEFTKQVVSRDKKFEYGWVLDWYGTVHIGIASGLLSLSETQNEASMIGILESSVQNRLIS